MCSTNRCLLIPLLFSRVCFGLLFLGNLKLIRPSFIVLAEKKVNINNNNSPKHAFNGILKD